MTEDFFKGPRPTSGDELHDRIRQGWRVEPALWYYRSLGQEWGPIGEGMLADLARRGQLGPKDWIRRSHDTAWQPAGRVFAFFPSQPLATAPQTSPGLTDILDQAPAVDVASLTTRPREVVIGVQPTLTHSDTGAAAGDLEPAANGYSARNRGGENRPPSSGAFPALAAPELGPSQPQPARCLASDSRPVDPSHPDHQRPGTSIRSARGLLAFGSLVACLILAAGAWQLRPSPRTPKTDAAVYQSLLNAWVRVQQGWSGNDPQERADVRREVEAELASAIARLEQAPPRNRRRRQLLMQVANEDLPGLLDAPQPEREKRIDALQRRLEEVRVLLRIDR